MRYFDRFEEDQLFTHWELPVTIFIDDQENFAFYVGDTDITNELTSDEMAGAIDVWREAKAENLVDEEADRLDWAYEQMRDRLMDKAGDIT